LRTALYGPLQRFEAERGRDPNKAKDLRFRLICDFNPEGRANSSEDFGACLTLAEELRDLQKRGVETIAFVHADVTRHAVLPVLACAESVMSKDPPSRLGRIPAPGRPLKPVERLAYEEIARNRYPLALVRKMFDRDLTVVKVPPGQKGDRYVDGNDRPRPRGEPVTDLGPGDTAFYTFTQASEFGLCQQAARNSLDEVREAYNLPRSALHTALDRVVACRVLAAGTLNGELREKVQRRVKRALGQKANLIILQLACGDGDPHAAYELAMYLAGLNDNRAERPVEVVAFVTNQSRNTAAFVALGCGKIVMQREGKDGDTVVQPAARLGDFDRILKESPSLEPYLRRNIGEIARKQHYPELLAEGLVSPNLRIFHVKPLRGHGSPTFISEEELKADQQHDHLWQVVDPPVKPDKDRPLSLTAERAEKLGIAAGTAATFEDLCEQEGVNPAEVRTLESDWLDSLADFLRDPWTSVVLVMVGITCMILELKMPGVVAPGCIAAICFVLFFWSHSQLNGQITWLALLLFVLGLLLIALEVFVLPGFGFAGISGILLVVGSLGLVAYGHWPRSNEEWAAFGQHVGPFGLSILGALVCAFVLARYLPSIPYVNRLILQPQGESEEGFEEAPDPVHAELAALLGAIGVSATPLRPAGKAQFGDAFVDVVAEGGYVVPGTRVQVIEIEGNRVVVKEV
jgi:hypothetical protein